MKRLSWYRIGMVLFVLAIASLACNLAGSPEVVTVVVTVEVPAQEGSAPPPIETPASTEQITEAPSNGGGVFIEARATTEVAIREHPGPGCPLIGTVPKDEVIHLLERTDFDPHWYKTDFLGPDQPGWVYNEFFTLLQDDSILPRVPEQGCLYCGDGVCSAEIGEVCDECTADCGVCPYCGDGVVNQASEQCDGSPAGCKKDYSCSSSCQCIAPTPVPKCGDGVVNGTEQCENNSQCKQGFVCQRCQCNPVVIP